jgi:hypothetical protein
MPEGRNPQCRRERLFEKRQTFGDQLRTKEGQPCNIATRPREAGDKSVSNRIAHHCYNNGDRSDHLLYCAGDGCGLRHDDVDFETDEFACQRRKLRRICICCSILKKNIRAFDVAEFA